MWYVIPWVLPLRFDIFILTMTHVKLTKSGHILFISLSAPPLPAPYIVFYIEAQNITYIIYKILFHCSFIVHLLEHGYGPWLWTMGIGTWL